MQTRTLFAVLALAGAALMATQAHAWRAGPWNTPAASQLRKMAEKLWGL